MLIDFRGKHTAVFGTTQEGKTHAVTRSLERSKSGVLFFDMKEEPVPGYVTAHKGDDAGLILDVLKSGSKVNYTPSRGTRFAEVAALLDLILDERMDCYIVCDECQLAFMQPDRQKRAASAAYQELATTGLSKGLKGVFIAQRPAIMPNTLSNLADLHVYFRTDEHQYLSRYMGEADAVDLARRLDEGGQYSYVTRYRGVLEGPYKV